MATITKVSPRVFRAIQSIDIEDLLLISPQEIRPILPCLVRMSLISPFDNTLECSEGRKGILTLLSEIELVNSIVALLSIDFHALESDVKKEQQLRQKIGSSQTDSILIQSLQGGLALEFERSDQTRKLRLVLSEVLFIASQLHQPQRNQEFYSKPSDLFDNEVYIEEICDVICIALAELPAVFNIQEVAETLLHVKHGPDMICWVVANSPDCFREVCIGLISNASSDRQDEDSVGSRVRMQALTMLCEMNPVQALAIRAKCVELCRMPALTIILSLQDHSATMGSPDVEGDMVAFVSGLLLGNDQQVRSWFVLFVRNVQKRKWDSPTALQMLRDDLLHRLQTLILYSVESQLPDYCVVQASALLRLYCALRGIAGIKYQEDEVSLIVALLTSHPPPTPAGVRFVSIGLCMLIACPSLIGQVEHEKKAIEWVQWLVSEEAYFESASGVSASFGEMLLLMAIHFHSNQLSAICELVCTTVGMKIPIRTNNMSRMKQIFTHEIFTEQVVTAHAVKVPVTARLNANIPGFLPIHCIHQLLKSRAFTKHRVPIKSWIYRQICCSEPPLHPVLPALVEVYVNSILVPSAKCPQEHTNQPIEEDEVRRVFQNSVLGAQFHSVKKLRVVTVKASGQEDMEIGEADPESKPSLTAQLLLLYYLLLYEDVRLSHKQPSAATVKRYSPEFLSQLPIKCLLGQAQKDQQSYAGLFPPLLRLLATHFPHLSLVDDWLDEELTVNLFRHHDRQEPVTSVAISQAFSNIKSCPSRVSRLLCQLLVVPATDAWPMADTFIQCFKLMLDDEVPRYIQELYKLVWLRLNTVLPRCLWAMTINALLPHGAMSLTQENLVLDPLQALRCDRRVFRCAPALVIALRILQALLAASRNHLDRHQRDRPLPDRPDQMTTQERNDLKNAIVATQDSLAVQVLLEACWETPEDQELPRRKWALREVQSVVCSHLHQVFIGDPPLAKLVHFQCYPRELVPVMVSGIPSMHICLDFIPELLSQASVEKQVFAVELVSHLALQYALPKSLSVSRLAVNTLSTLLSVLTYSSRVELFVPCLPALVRICKAFPPLLDDVISLLLQIAHVSMAHESLDKMTAGSNNHLGNLVMKTFTEIETYAVFDGKLYS